MRVLLLYLLSNSGDFALLVTELCTYGHSPTFSPAGNYFDSFFHLPFSINMVNNFTLLFGSLTN